MHLTGSQNNPMDVILTKYLNENIALNNEAAAFLKHAPDGCICCDRRGSTSHYRQRIFSGGSFQDKFLTHKDKKLILNLSLKPYYKLIDRFSSRNIKIIVRFRNAFMPDIKEAAIRNLPAGVKEIVAGAVDTREKWMKEWADAEYRKSNYLPEERNIKTLSGVMVRTKSEEKIADYLYMAGIAFRYEQMLVIGGEIRFPDFVILHPASTPKRLILIIWEHAGKMDDREKYEPDALNKLKLYCDNGLIVNLNMIYTTETLQDKLSTDTVKLEIERLLTMVKGSPIVEIDGCCEIAD